MKFNFTPDEAQLVAKAIARHLSKKGMKVKLEVAGWGDAPYRTTLLATQSGLRLLVEAQGALVYHKALSELSVWMAAQRHYAELYLGTSADAPTNAGVLAELGRAGVGLFVVDDNGRVSISIKARNPALVVTPDPTLKLGPCSADVSGAIKKFNEVDRKDGLRDMCEIVERETEALAIRSARKGYLTMNEKDIESKDWSSQINALASINAYNVGYTPMVDDKFKTDLHSFRGARNLVDHPPKGKRDSAKRQMQFQERMMQGPRLVAELISLKRKVT